jgi:hypothetical protein
MTYEVQTLTFLNNWENTWTDDDAQPTQFDTREAAAAELAGFLEDMAFEASRKHLADFNPSDYRIVKNDHF